MANPVAAELAVAKARAKNALSRLDRVAVRLDRERIPSERVSSAAYHIDQAVRIITECQKEAAK